MRLIRNVLHHKMCVTRYTSTLSRYITVSYTVIGGTIAKKTNGRNKKLEGI